jgi:hypothetical protein
MHAPKLSQQEGVEILTKMVGIARKDGLELKGCAPPVYNCVGHLSA